MKQKLFRMREACAPLLATLLATAGLMALSAQARAADSDTQQIPICTDRPTKANVPCTVPKGQWQLETDVGNQIVDRQPVTRTETLYFTNPTIKYGIGTRTDLQLNWAPDIRIRTNDRATDERHSLSGGGDVYVRLKTRVFENDRVSIAAIPFVKAPTARTGIGNGMWEGGVALPVGITLPSSFTLTLGPEVDALANSGGNGRHAAVVNLANLSHPLGSRTTFYVEMWSMSNRDPSGTVKQSSADIAVTWLATPTLQLDAGANFGLNDATPHSQVYVGLSRRF
ncbi:transporter [Solilutibacter silvestris]|uniref:Putative MetA-pathway of phenol degradation protein n=1 Tax=Solilutibacter silvestris TaxID=1645665 RepID=A0A2K1PZ85_9GAMM|nr:transporter [Lysobacter silvestris]PNS08103.1 putative MetA-pathway of phenol degradation protein [Lysobacter silvestris]